MYKILALIGLIAALILGYFCVYNHNTMIQQDVTDRLTSRLEAEGLDASLAGVDGRDILLQGNVSSIEDRNRIEAIARKIIGVRTVHNQLIIPDEVAPIVQVDVTPVAPVIVDQDAAVIAEAEKQAVIAKTQVCENTLATLLEKEKIQFASSKAVINKSSYRLLNSIVTELNKCSGASIVVEGHSDSSGNDAKNLVLSEKRAAAVVEYLKKAGVTQPLTPKGYGETQPIVSNETPEGRATNRRIDFKLSIAE